MKHADLLSSAVKKVAKGDKLAMNWLYTFFVKEMLTISFRITNNLSDSEDIIQESFIQSFDKIGQLKKATNYKHWLKRMVVNNSLKKIQKRRYFQDIEDHEIVEKEEESNWYEGVAFGKIQEAIQLLPDGCREILCLYLLEEYKHKEIASLLDISVSTSKSQYRYAITLLRTKLKKLINE